MKYVAFFRGINVGGNTKVSMEELKKMFASMGSTEVKTILNSGNVVFEDAETDVRTLIKRIEENLEKTLGFSICVLLRTKEQIESLVASKPFGRVAITSQTRLYVTFVADLKKTTLQIPFHSPEKDFSILSLHEGAVLSVLELSPKRNTTDVMKFLEKAFGKDITTRNWNTIIKVSKAFSLS